MKSARLTTVAAVLAVTAFVVLVGDVAGAARPHKLAPCSSTDVAVSWGVVRGSQGAGQTSYALRVKNVSSVTCRIGGLPKLVLLNKQGATLPTKVSVACANCNEAVLNLRPGISAWSDGRFSPDVPGTGENHRARCEPIAFDVRVTLPATIGSVVGAIRPPTSVCSHGSISLSYLGAVKPST